MRHTFFFIIIFSAILLCSSQEFISSHHEHEILFGSLHFYHGAQSRIPKSVTALSHIAYGFVPYWERSYNCPRWDLVSRIAYFNCTFNSSGDITNTNHWYDASVVDSAIAHGVPVDLCIAVFDDATINEIISNPSSRANCIHNAIDAMLARGGEGINIDFEHPGSGYGDELVVFMAEFRDSLDMRAPGAWLSICLPSVDWRDNYHSDQLKYTCDAMFIMGYGYHWSGSAYTGAVDPLDDPSCSYDLAYSVDEFGIESGALEKIILGLPAYGYDWACDGPDKGAATTATGTAIFYMTALANAETYGRLWDDDADSPWYRYSSWHQCWYSDSQSLALRYQFAKDEGLMGIGWWALGYDDGDDAFWGAVEECFAGTTAVDTVDTVIVDNGDPEYSTGGTWTDGTYAPENGWENDYQFCSIGAGIDWARWNPDLSRTGVYGIYMWWYAGGNRCDNVMLRIAGIDDDTVYISQQGSGAEWHYLGNFDFQSGNSGFVEIYDEGAIEGSVVIADAVMWIYTSPLFVQQLYRKPDNIEMHITPNPFNSLCQIRIQGVDGSKVQGIEIYDLRGTLRLHSVPGDNGSLSDDCRTESSQVEMNYTRTFIWCPDESIASGIYLVRARAEDGNCISKRVVYLK